VALVRPSRSETTSTRIPSVRQQSRAHVPQVVQPDHRQSLLPQRSGHRRASRAAALADEPVADVVEQPLVGDDLGGGLPGPSSLRAS